MTSASRIPYQIKLAAIAAMTSAAASAQQQVLDAAPLAAPRNIVVVKGDANAARRDDSVSRIVVNRNDILKFGDPSLLDVMKRLPGVTVNDLSVRLRGLGGYTQILINGERPPAGFSLDTLSPDAVERIEIFRSATAEFTTQGIAGTINVVLRKAVSKAAGEMKLGIGAGPNTRADDASLAWSDKSDKRSYNFGARFVHSDNVAEAHSIETEHDPGVTITNLRDIRGFNRNVSNGLNLNGRVNWSYDDGDRLTWEGFANGSKYHGDGHIVTATLIGDRYPYPDETVRASGDNWDVRNNLEWLRHLSDTVKLEMKGGLYGTRRQLNFGRSAYDEAELSLHRMYVTDAKERGATWTGKYSLAVGTAHSVAFGWDTSYSRFQQREVQLDAVLPNQGSFNFDNGYGALIRRLAVYLQDEWKITPAWSLYLGMRDERLEVKTDAYSVSATSSSHVFSPLLQTLWKLPGNRRDQVRLAITRTYKAPELSRLVPTRFYASYNTPVTPDASGNPSLRPELASGLDLTYERYWDNGAMVSVSASARDITNLIRDKVHLQVDRWILMPENSGNASVRTLDVETKFPLKSLFPSAPAIDTKFSASRNWSSVSGVPGPDNRLDRQPPWSANVGADYRVGAWSGGVNFSLAAGGPIRTSTTQLNSSKARRDLDTYVVHRMTPSRQLRVALRNVLKTGTETLTKYSDQNSSFERRRALRGFLNWRIQLEQKF